MPAQLISGREIAATIREELQTRVADLRESTGRVPGLATVLVVVFGAVGAEAGDLGLDGFFGLDLGEV